MKRKSLVVLTLLLIAALMAGIGTGALDVFSAKRSAAMTIVNDSDALISIKGDDLYAKQTNKGLKLDFTNTSFGGKGFNPQSKSEFYNVFTITNQSEKTVFVWLESNEKWKTHHQGITYRIDKDNCSGNITRPNEWWKNQPQGLNLLHGSGQSQQFKDGKDGQSAFVELAPGKSFDVNILINSVMSNGYGDANTPYSDWSHDVIVKANGNAPILRP